MTARRRFLRLATEQATAAPPFATRVLDRWATELDDRPHRLATWCLLATAGLAGGSAGPVAGGIAAAYTAWAVFAWHRHRADRRTVRHRRSIRHTIGLLAADVRAGAHPVGLLAPDRIDGHDPVSRQIRRRLTAIRDVSERVGTPAADLLDRLAADLRSRAHTEALVAGQTAGAGASSRVLAGLPVAGLLLGSAIGADPVRVLLHTPIGAGCAVIAVAAQLVGLAWSRRIIATAVPVVA